MRVIIKGGNMLRVILISVIMLLTTGCTTGTSYGSCFYDCMLYKYGRSFICVRTANCCPNFELQNCWKECKE